MIERTPSTEELQEALARFGVKQAADLSSLIPSVAGAPVGGYLGYLLGGRYGKPQLGAMLGSVTGGVAGRVLADAASQPNQPQVPPGAPYALDPTDQDIPAWALQGAQMLRPVLKQSSHEGVRDVVLGDMLGPVYPAVEGARNGGGLGGALKHVAGSSAGIAAGGLLGHGLGALLNAGRAPGNEMKVPGLNIPVSTILSGLGATIGGVKGLEWARGK